MSEQYPSGPVPHPGYPGYPGYPPVADAGAPGAAPYGYGLGHGYRTRPRNSMGTAALTLGILAIVPGAFIYVGAVLGVLAVIFGAIGRARSTRGEATNRGSATAGMILGATGIVLTVVVAVVYAHLITQVRACERSFSTQRQIVRCIRHHDQPLSRTVPTTVPALDAAGPAGPAGRPPQEAST